MRTLFIIAFFLCSLQLFAREIPPGKYILSGVSVEGAEYSDKNSLLLLSGLTIGSEIEIPGAAISDAMHKLWDQKLFSDISFEAENIMDDKLFMKIIVIERPRISKYSFSGITKSNADDLREKIKIVRGTILTEPKKRQTERIIKNFYQDKGYYQTQVTIESQPDTSSGNMSNVNIKVKKGSKIKIGKITIDGNSAIASKKLKSKLKKTKEAKTWRVWAKSKFIRGDYNKDLATLTAFYNSKGYRDARIITDSVYMVSEKRMNIDIKLIEGNQYFIRNINWVGNAKYSADTLDKILGMRKGDVYNQALLDKRLNIDPAGTDVSSLYLDDGYLFFRTDVVETQIIGDSVDLEIRMHEGPQARINKIILEGNDKTSDYVVLRELRTLPGNKFSRADLIRSQREISALNYFNPETINIIPIPDQNKGTVDLKYVVEEKSSDQLQLQGGWGGRVRDQNGNVIGGGFVGTLGLTFNNFSTKRFFQKGAWNPIPAGDGQKLSLSIQANGAGFQNYAVSFTEPWFGGKKPNSLGVNLNYSIQRSLYTGFRMNIFGASVDLGRRLKKPDDYFSTFTSLGYRNYYIREGSATFTGINNGDINIISLKQVIDRNSLDSPIFPRTGSQLTFSVEATPPYSLFSGKDYTTISSTEKYRWTEYHKWKFDGSWFVPITKKTTVFNARFRYGFLGYYSKAFGISPFERFQYGGDGLANFSFFGLEIVGMRGYDVRDFAANSGYGTIFGKTTLELRQAISLESMATIWVHAFFDAGNVWNRFDNFNPFQVKKSFGLGVRVFMPMFGLLGLDAGIPMDPAFNGQWKPKFTFVLGQQL